MKQAELRLVSELMMNSKRSDRDLAKTIGVSQPTVTRIRHKLEKEGYIKEYTIIPDLNKLGYEIMALTFFKLKGDVDGGEIEEIRRKGLEMTKASPLEMVMIERGLGLGFSVVSISFHKDYSAYRAFREWLKQFAFLAVDDMGSFLISMSDDVHYLYPTASNLAKHLLTLGQKER